MKTIPVAVHYRKKNGRGSEIRTRDFLLPKQARYQLRYAPTVLNNISQLFKNARKFFFFFHRCLKKYES